MRDKVRITLLFSLVFGILLVNPVNADMLVSDSGVQYESRILAEFAKLSANEITNETFLKVIIHLKNISEADDLISEFSENELKGVINRNIPNKSSETIGATISEEAFFKLIQDERVDKIYYNTPIKALSTSGVEYDDELMGQFLVNDWVHVTVDVKDFSNIVMDYKGDSIEEQTDKDNQRWDAYRNTSEAILSTLSEEEFQLKKVSDFGTFFSGNITKEGFEKLLNDERVKKIYAKKNFYKHSIESIKNSLVYIILIILVIIFIILLIKSKKRRWKAKR